MDYVFKLVISLTLFLPLYGVLLGVLSHRLIAMTGAPALRRARAVDN